MKRRDLLRHLEEHGCHLHREGVNNFILTYKRGADGRRLARRMPRHTPDESGQSGRCAGPPGPGARIRASTSTTRRHPKAASGR